MKWLEYSYETPKYYLSQKYREEQLVVRQQQLAGILSFIIYKETRNI